MAGVAGLFAAWVLATWLLEGRIHTLLRPEAAVDRAIYAIVANLLIGILAAIAVLRFLVRGKYLQKSDAGFGTAAPSFPRLILAFALGSVLYVALGAPSLHPIVLTNAFAQVLVVSAAEVVVCWAVAGATVEAMIRPHGKVLSFPLAAVAASVLFGVYHFAHSPPFNTYAMVVLLTGIGVLTSAFFLLVRDVYATVIFHNCLGVFGVLQALEASGRLSSFEELQPFLLIMAFIVLLAMGLADRIWLRPQETAA